jgi:hypothetical protein
VVTSAPVAEPSASSSSPAVKKPVVIRKKPPGKPRCQLVNGVELCE